MSSGGRASPGFAGAPFGGQFDGELSPEDLFNMFFGGGGMGGGGFGGGPGTTTSIFRVLLSYLPFRILVFTTTFGPGGFRTTRFRTHNAQQQQRQEAEPRSIFIQLLPLFILFAFSFINMIPNLFTTPPTPDPRFSFKPTHRYNLERQTHHLGVKYHVNAAEFSGHPIAAELARKEQQQPGPQLQKFEGSVERVYTQDLYTQCQYGLDRKEQRKDREVGLFGIGTDWEKVKRITEEPIESCDELKRLGLLK